MRSVFIPLCLMLAVGCSARQPVEHRLELTAAEFYRGLAADNVMLTSAGEIAIDPRKLADGEAVRGELVTDAIDLADPDGRRIAPAAELQKLEATVWGSTPASGAIELFVRWGDSFFDTTGWSGWERAEGLSGTFAPEGARYCQVKAVLTADGPRNSPRLSGLTVSGTFDVTGPADTLDIVTFDNPRIVRSSMEFHYERADQPDIAEFVERNRLRELVSDCAGELDTLTTLLDWVGSTRNTRHTMFAGGAYPWDIDRIVSYDEDGEPSIEGHCMSYAVAYITALTGLGFHARHWADRGFRFADHEVVEVWSNSLGKWIYMDPSLSHYYRHTETGEPCSILELHRVFVDTFFRDGESLRMDMEAQRERVAEIGGKNVPLEFVGGRWSYGKPLQDYDWGWLHGYLAAGFMRLTTRNDYHSYPEKLFEHFGEGVHDFDVFLSWSDEKTPVSEKITRFSDRERDFYWTLDQARIKPVRSGGRRIEAELGHSMPFFSEFLVSVDGGAPEEFTGNRYQWELHPGRNSLRVVPRSEWGRTGIPAVLEIDLPQ